MAVAIVLVFFLLVAIVLPISLLVFRLGRGDEVVPTSEGKQFFGRLRRDRD
jgi:hypothetical protein